MSLPSQQRQQEEQPPCRSVEQDTAHNEEEEAHHNSLRGNNNNNSNSSTTTTTGAMSEDESAPRSSLPQEHWERVLQWRYQQCQQFSVAALQRLQQTIDRGESNSHKNHHTTHASKPPPPSPQRQLLLDNLFSKVRQVLQTCRSNTVTTSRRIQAFDGLLAFLQAVQGEEKSTLAQTRAQRRMSSPLTASHNTTASQTVPLEAPDSPVQVAQRQLAQASTTTTVNDVATTPATTTAAAATTTANSQPKLPPNVPTRLTLDQFATLQELLQKSQRRSEADPGRKTVQDMVRQYSHTVQQAGYLDLTQLTHAQLVALTAFVELDIFVVTPRLRALRSNVVYYHTAKMTLAATADVARRKDNLNHNNTSSMTSSQFNQTPHRTTATTAPTLAAGGGARKDSQTASSATTPTETTPTVSVQTQQTSLSAPKTSQRVPVGAPPPNVAQRVPLPEGRNPPFVPPRQPPVPNANNNQQANGQTSDTRAVPPPPAYPSAYSSYLGRPAPYGQPLPSGSNRQPPPPNGYGLPPPPPPRRPAVTSTAATNNTNNNGRSNGQSSSRNGNAATTVSKKAPPALLKPPPPSKNSNGGSTTNGHAAKKNTVPGPSLLRTEKEATRLARSVSAPSMTSETAAAAATESHGLHRSASTARPSAGWRVPKNWSQDDYQYHLQVNLGKFPTSLRGHLQRIAKLGGIPRTEQTFIKHCTVSKNFLTPTEALQLSRVIGGIIHDIQERQQTALGKENGALQNQHASLSLTTTVAHSGAKTMAASNAGSTQEGGDTCTRPHSKTQPQTAPLPVPVPARLSSLPSRKRDMSHIAMPDVSCVTAERMVKMTTREDDAETPYSNSVKPDPDEKGIRNGRGPLQMNFMSHSVTPKVLPRIAERVHKWLPFWDVTAFVTVFQTDTVAPESRTPASLSAFQVFTGVNKAYYHNGKVVGKMDIDNKEWARKRASDAYKPGETRLLLCMLPHNPPVKKRPDGHLWPKGTFLQLIQPPKDKGGKPVIVPIRLDQRRQQDHDKKLWKGMSKVLDLTQHIPFPDKLFRMEGVTHDAELYYGCLVYAKFREPKMVLERMMDRKSPDCILQLTEIEGMKKALQFATSKMMILDDDVGGTDDKNGSEEEAGKAIFSLTDVFSKSLMKIPVRGMNCKHVQCFDLPNFIHGNAFVSGNQWRCCVCERFLSWQDLEYCGFMAKLLQEFGLEASSLERDRVELSANGSYRLLDERQTTSSRQRNKRQRESSSDGVSLGHGATGTGTTASKKSKPTEPEVIEIID